MSIHTLPRQFRAQGTHYTKVVGIRPLSQANRAEQTFVTAQLVRNKYALDYWFGTLTDIKSRPWFKHKIKRLYNQIDCERTNYYNTLQGMFRRGEVDPWEMVQDGAYEYNREIKRMVYFYEQAVTRLLQKAKFEDVQLMCKLSTAKSLMNLAAYIMGCECQVCPGLQPMLQVGGSVYYEPSMNKAEDCRQKALPSVMGHFQHMCEQMNDLILRAIGRHDGYEIDESGEIERSMEIAGENIQRTFTDYDLMTILMSDHGHTVEEAKEIIAKRKAELAEKEAKEQEKQIKKAAKAEHKKSKTK